MKDVTRILHRLDGGDQQAISDLFQVVYEELKRIAAAQMAREQPGQTLQSTALVSEMYLRVFDVAETPTFANRRHFFAAAAEAMRRILIDQSRKKRAAKRGGGRISLKSWSRIASSRRVPKLGWRSMRY